MCLSVSELLSAPQIYLFVLPPSASLSWLLQLCTKWRRNPPTFTFLFCFCVLETGSNYEHKLALNSRSSCLSLRNAGVTGTANHAQFCPFIDYIVWLVGIVWNRVSYIVQDGLTTPMQSRVLLSSWPYYLHLPNIRITGTCHHAWLWVLSMFQMLMPFKIYNWQRISPIL